MIRFYSIHCPQLWQRKSNEGENSRVNTDVSSFFCRSCILSFSSHRVASRPPPPFPLRCSSAFLRLPLSHPSSSSSAPSSSVGVNLSPRLSPNPELYKLKPISLPGLRSSYSATLFSFICCRQTCPVFLAAASNQQRPTAAAFRSHTLYHHHVDLHVHPHYFVPRIACIRVYVFVGVRNFAHGQLLHISPSLLCRTVCGYGSVNVRTRHVHAWIFTWSSDRVGCTESRVPPPEMEKRSSYKFHIEYSYKNSTRIPCVSVFLTTKRNLCFVAFLRCARSTKVCSVSMNSLPTTCAPEIALYGRVHALKILCEREHLAYTRVSRSRAPEDVVCIYVWKDPF